jgi:serine/threonine-protein kinase RsbW
MTGWGFRGLPAIGERLAQWTVDTASQLQTLRAALQQAVLTTVSAAADRLDLVERITIVATELAGNALRHTDTPAVVTLLRANGNLIVEVGDGDRVAGPAVDTHRVPGDGGLGLVLAERLAEDVGWYHTDTGKQVWATFAVAPH